jgi:V8-like Glu-specific endopeptidase
MKRSKGFLSLEAAVAGIALFSSLLLLPLSVSAGPNGDQVVTNDSSQRGPTTEEMKHSKPYVNPHPAPDTSSVQPLGGDFPRALTETAPAAVEPQGFTNLQAYGELGVPYTSKRVTLDPLPKDVKISANAGAYLSATYPYRTVGRLNFMAQGEWTHCSASLILRSVIVTAAHCIQDFGKGTETFSNWTFVPAYFKANRSEAEPVIPYGKWLWEAYVRPASWAAGNDTTWNDDAHNNDLAVILLEKDAENEFIGDKIGWLRYGQTEDYFMISKRTGDLWTGALTTLGYPGKSDNGEIQQRCDGPSYVTKLDKVLQMYQGSDFTGGSSGGPWVANFGYQVPVFSEGAGPGEKAHNNVVVGVTSWGDGKPGPQYDNYSSLFGRNDEYSLGNYGGFGAGNIGALLNSLCSKKPEGSDQTYRELGYCDRKK